MSLCLSLCLFKMYLDKASSCWNLPVEVFLSLLLLHFEGKPRAKDSLMESKKHEGKNKV